MNPHCAWILGQIQKYKPAADSEALKDCMLAVLEHALGGC